MTKIMHTQLTGLAATMANLKERVRVAVAGELGRAVGDAMRQVVEAVEESVHRRLGCVPL